jgi:hypothetical protein
MVSFHCQIILTCTFNSLLFLGYIIIQFLYLIMNNFAFLPSTVEHSYFNHHQQSTPEDEVETQEEDISSCTLEAQLTWGCFFPGIVNGIIQGNEKDPSYGIVGRNESGDPHHNISYICGRRDESQHKYSDGEQPSNEEVMDDSEVLGSTFIIEEERSGIGVGNYCEGE